MGCSHLNADLQLQQPVVEFSQNPAGARIPCERFIGGVAPELMGPEVVPCQLQVYGDVAGYPGLGSDGIKPVQLILILGGIGEFLRGEFFGQVPDRIVFREGLECVVGKTGFQVFDFGGQAESEKSAEGKKTPDDFNQRVAKSDGTVAGTASSSQKDITDDRDIVIIGNRRIAMRADRPPRVDD